uniref:Uncharacterized protein n=1 Tax=Lepeophtheirus salmonis TaxID=72036 RepID=A0A0K2TU88_LEPSM
MILRLNLSCDESKIKSTHIFEILRPF